MNDATAVRNARLFLGKGNLNLKAQAESDLSAAPYPEMHHLQDCQSDSSPRHMPRCLEIAKETRFTNALRTYEDMISD